jgi:hypothetical protein
MIQFLVPTKQLIFQMPRAALFPIAAVEHDFLNTSNPKVKPFDRRHYDLILCIQGTYFLHDVICKNILLSMV